MKIHTDVLERSDLYYAAAQAGATITRLGFCGSRSRKHGIDVYLSGSSPYQQWGGTGYNAASWDEWGTFIAILFRRDPKAIIGRYKTFESFNAFTKNRFGMVLPHDTHNRHKWDYNMGRGLLECNTCSAVMNNSALI